jgi:endonuclease III
MAPEAKIRRILGLLERAYGRILPLKRSAPVDELIRTVLSQNTSDKNSIPAFHALKKYFPSWDRVLKADMVRIASLIKHAGLANIKAKRIKEVLREIKQREGRISLARLGCMSVEEAAGYLRSIKGIGPKTAACVLLFSFAKPVMPVDTHIFRVAKRLGLIGKSLNIEEAHTALTAMVPKGLIYKFHLCIIEHGRRTCKAVRPLCEACVLYDMCGYKLKSLYRRKNSEDKKSHRI